MPATCVVIMWKLCSNQIITVLDQARGYVGLTIASFFIKFPKVYLHFSVSYLFIIRISIFLTKCVHPMAQLIGDEQGRIWPTI